MRVNAIPFQVDGARPTPAAGAPYRVGEHTRALLTEVLGYDADRFAAKRIGPDVVSFTLSDELQNSGSRADLGKLWSGPLDEGRFFVRAQAPFVGSEVRTSAAGGAARAVSACHRKPFP